MKNKFKIHFKTKFLIIMNIFFFFNYSYSVDWYQLYNEKWKNGISPSSSLPWSETYTLRSFISMYRASKARNESTAEQNKWIDRIIQHSDYIINSPKMEIEGKDNLVYAGHGFTPLSNVIKLIFNDDKLYALYKDKANQYLLYLEQKLIPYWKNYNFKETPFNWFLSYGTMLIYLHQITESKHYNTPDYQAPDPSLKDYYLNTVSDMSANYFQDFKNWDYSGKGWNDTPFPKNKGLCYYPQTDSYLWRYFDYPAALICWGYIGETEYQGLENSSFLDLDKWYKFDLKFNNDSLKMFVYASDGITLISETDTPWKLTNTENDFIIGKRVDGNEYFNGVIDEIKFSKDKEIIAELKMDGNAFDSSGNNNNGIIFGKPETVSGRFGKALKFSSGDYFKIPNKSNFDSINRIELWVKFNEFNTARYYILGRGKHFQYGPGGIHLFMDCYKRPEDVGHANLDIDFLINAANDPHFERYYPKSILNRVCNTFTKNIWSNSDTINPTFRSHIEPKSDYGKADEVVHTFRWLWLYQYDPFVGNLVSNWYSANPNAQSLSEAIANLACWQAGVSLKDENTSEIEENQNIKILKISPNPAIEYIEINVGAGSKPALVNDIEIFNIFGERTTPSDLSPALSEREGVKRIDISNLVPGVYFIRIGDKFEKFVKM
jgi:hypothetical protein